MRGTPLKVTIFKKYKGKNTTKMEYLNTLEQIGSKKNICDIFFFYSKRGTLNVFTSYHSFFSFLFSYWNQVLLHVLDLKSTANPFKMPYSLK